MNEELRDSTDHLIFFGHVLFFDNQLTCVHDLSAASKFTQCLLTEGSCELAVEAYFRKRCLWEKQNTTGAFDAPPPQTYWPNKSSPNFMTVCDWLYVFVSALNVCIQTCRHLLISQLKVTKCNKRQAYRETQTNRRTSYLHGICETSEILSV